jgi:hypothetical protein
LRPATSTGFVGSAGLAGGVLNPPGGISAGFVIGFN